MSRSSRCNGNGRTDGSREPDSWPSGDGGAPMPQVSSSAPPVEVIPFTALLEAAGASREDDLAAAIKSDAAYLAEMGIEAHVARYGEAIDFVRYPQARLEAVKAHARSLETLGNVPAALARKLAEAEAEAVTNQAESEPGTPGLQWAGRRVSPHRAAMSGPVAHVPGLSIIAVILALGILATGGWTIVATARAERAEARAIEERDRADRAQAEADTAYERGMNDKALEMAAAVRDLRDREEDLGKQAERQLAEIALMQEEARANLEKTKALWTEAAAEVDAIIEEIEADVQDGYVQNAAEFFLRFEEIVNASAEWDDALLEDFSQARLDTLVMPSLHLIYNTDLFGDGDYLDEVHDLLAQLEARRIDAARERLESGGG